jgi:hypothetical protein
MPTAIEDQLRAELEILELRAENVELHTKLRVAREREARFEAELSDLRKKYDVMIAQLRHAKAKFEQVCNLSTAASKKKRRGQEAEAAALKHQKRQMVADAESVNKDTHAALKDFKVKMSEVHNDKGLSREMDAMALDSA